jgi:curved DNA-binding protein CbpA
MTDPYEVLNLSPDSDDDTIRRRYLELVRQYPPERSPEKFAAIRQAYESLRVMTERVRYRLFDRAQNDWIE